MVDAVAVLSGKTSCLLPFTNSFRYVYCMLEEVSQKNIPISYNIFFCGTSSSTVAEEEAPATEEDTLIHMGKGLFVNDNTNFWGFLYPPLPPIDTFGHPP